MKKNIKLFIKLYVLSLFVFLMGCESLERLEEGTQDPFSNSMPQELNETDYDAATDYAKKNHGIVNIHRHGPGYDVMMMLNAGESDIIFSMDLPAGAQGEEGFSEGPFTNASNDMADTKGDELVEGQTAKLEGEKQFFNKKSLAMFSEATKHMLSAQALFYRKSYWKALEETNRAMSLVPSSAQAYALKGSIYYKMGRKKEAKSAWKRAVKLDPSLTEVKDSLKLVK